MTRSWASSDPVAGLGHGLDDRRVTELTTQSAHGYLDGRGERVGHLIPYPLQDLLGRHDPALGGEQQFQDAELLGTEIELMAAPAGVPAWRVERRLSVDQHRPGPRVGPAR